jgi:hypothetical protein
LLSRGRWADASRLIGDGVHELERHRAYFTGGEMPADIDEELKEHIAQMGRDSFRRKSAEIRHVLIAGGRIDEASAVEQKALAIDPSDEMREWLAKPREKLLER